MTTQIRDWERYKLILALALVISAVFALAIVPSAQAATPIYVRPAGDDALCNGTVDVDYSIGAAPNCAVQTIGQGVTLVDPGGTVYVAGGTYVLSAVVTINKTGVTLDGDGAGVTIIQVSGTGDRIDIAASGVTVQDFEIEKTDTAGEQNIIRISNGNSVTVKNNTIHGQYVYPAGDTSRAIIINGGGFSGLNIEGNTIYSLRQPAYVSGTHTGTVQNNYVYATKGWVLEGGDLTFSGNTWGTGAQANVYDIAILSTMPGAYYTDIVAMSNANNGAVIEDQRVGPPVLSVVNVDASAPVCGADCGGRNPYHLITPAIPRVVAGGTIKVAAGTYAESLTIDRSLTLQCAQAGVAVGGRTAGSPSETVINASGLAKAMVITASNVAVDGCDIVGNGATYAGVQIYATSGAGNLSNVDVLNNFIHGMALPNPSSSAYVTSYGVFGLGDLESGTRRTLSDVTIQGNAIYGLGGVVSGPDTSAGAGVWLYGVQGALPGQGATITGNSFSNIASGLDGGVPEPGVGVAIIDDGDGVPDQGAAINNNSYLNTYGGVVALVSGSSVAEAGAIFTNTPMLVLNVGNLTTVNEALLAKYAKTNQPTGYPSSTAYFAQIQGAITNSDAGAAISVTAGTFNENVVVNKFLTLTGAGNTPAGTVIAGTGTGVGLNIAASGLSSSNRLVVSDLRVTNFNHGLQTSGASFVTFANVVSTANLGNGLDLGNATDLLLTGCELSYNTNGIRAGTAAMITDFEMDGCAVNHNNMGLVIFQMNSGASNFSDVLIKNSTFNENKQKGIYVEKLHNAVFDNLVVDHSGWDTGYQWSAGVDINLKYRTDYANISFVNPTITDNGVGALYGVGLTIKARDDAPSYSGNPASLDNVSINGGVVDGNQVGVRFSEPGQTNAGPTNVTISQVCFDNNITAGLVNGSLATTMAVNNAWGSATGPFNATSNPGGTGDAVSDNVTFVPWLIACGGSSGNFHNVTDNTFFATMQAAVNAASYGDVIVPLAPGPFGAEGSATVATNGVTIKLMGRTFGPGSPAFTITGNDVTILGPGVIDGGGSAFPGILVQAGAGNFTLREAEVKGWADGIQVAGAVISLKLTNNWIHDNTDAGLQVDATPSGVITINGNLFKANGGHGVVYGGSGALNATYNSWGDLGGPMAGNGDGVGAGVSYIPWTFSELFMDVDPPANALTRSVPETTSFDVALKVDAAKLYGMAFQFTYDPTKLTLNTTTFSAPWAGACMPILPYVPGQVKYRCNLLHPTPEYDAAGGVIATFNFTANIMSPGNGPWPTYFDISVDPLETSTAAKGGIKVFVNNAGFGAPSVPSRDITDADDGEIIIVGLANYTGFVDLQGNTNDSGATLLVKNQLAKLGSVDLASGTSTPSGAYTTAHLSPEVVLVGSTYWLQFDAPLHLPTTAMATSPSYLILPSDWLNSALAANRPLTTLANAFLLGGDATNNDVVNLDDATCIGAVYLQPFTDCSGLPGSSPDVRTDGAVNLYDLVLMGSNYYLTSSPWTQP
jgi:hypothetical protein